ncbi:MAG TPA: hypothetical protein VFB66_02850 [Tepidisphaeraceae bacterium]|nr:hypothetical protein [Tepidisphaeraceae bacterium]
MAEAWCKAAVLVTGVLAAEVLWPAAFCGSASAQARLEYLSQSREVRAETSHRADAPELEERVAAQDFGPFQAEAVSYLFDPEDLDSALARVTQHSRLDPSGATASGVLDIDAGGEFGRGHARFDTRFEVVGAPTPYTFRYDLRSAGDFEARGVPFRAAVGLRGPGGDVVPETEISLFLPADPDLGPSEVHFIRSGVLEPGTYDLHFTIEAFSVSWEDEYQATYDVALTVPEPCGPWAAVGVVAGAMMRRRRPG